MTTVGARLSRCRGGAGDGGLKGDAMEQERPTGEALDATRTVARSRRRTTNSPGERSDITAARRLEGMGYPLILALRAVNRGRHLALDLDVAIQRRARDAQRPAEMSAIEWLLSL
jgi:hypothetical protein